MEEESLREKEHEPRRAGGSGLMAVQGQGRKKLR